MSRPKNENPPDKKVTTSRLPNRLHRYMKTIASMKYGTLQLMYTEMLDAFLYEKPWLTAGLRWRETKALTGKPARGKRGVFLLDSEATGWSQVNFAISPQLIAEVEALAEDQGVSSSAVLYTACYWWAWFVYPPEHEVVAREAAGLPTRVVVTQVG
ncbi:hypothetical protein [Acidiphilium acidophilum]|uniref:hypothetical protein n=1 Tax=Acidiphilium acidophilum TaxID=76588 RepID=UPI002E8E6177|nr:hypothetical protein [Acidiphilium acidophilum]